MYVCEELMIGVARTFAAGVHSTVCQKESSPLKLFVIFSLRLSIFP